MEANQILKQTTLPAAILTVALGATAVLQAADQNWPQWRGPRATGEAPGANPPLTWSDTENVTWKTKIPGRGTATPIIWGDQVFVVTAIPTGKKPQTAEVVPSPVPAAQVAQPQPQSQPGQPGDRPRRGPGGGGGMRNQKPTEPYQFALLSLNRVSGEILWQKVAREETPHEGHHPDHGFASSSPVTDGEHIYAYFGSRGLYCFDLAGNKKWEKEFGRMQTKNSFGEGSSPALSAKYLVVNWDHEGEDFIAALDKSNGKEVWRQKREEDTSWSTPLVVEHGGKAHVVTAATGKVRAYDLESGELLWQAPGLTANTIPTPVSGHGLVFAMSGFRGSALYAIKLGAKGDLAGGDGIAWSHQKNTPYVPSPLLSGERLYFLSGNQGIVSCFEAKTGKVLIDAERVEGLQGIYASPVAANGRVYLVGRNGVTIVIKDADKLEILATNKLEDRTDASPAIVGKQLFLRGAETLYCLAER